MFSDEPTSRSTEKSLTDVRGVRETMKKNLEELGVHSIEQLAGLEKTANGTFVDAEELGYNGGTDLRTLMIRALEELGRDNLAQQYQNLTHLYETHDLLTEAQQRSMLAERENEAFVDELEDEVNRVNSQIEELLEELSKDLAFNYEE